MNKLNTGDQVKCHLKFQSGNGTSHVWHFCTVLKVCKNFSLEVVNNYPIGKSKRHTKFLVKPADCILSEEGITLAAAEYLLNYEQDQKRKLEKRINNEKERADLFNFLNQFKEFEVRAVSMFDVTLKVMEKEFKGESLYQVVSRAKKEIGKLP